VVRKGRNSSPSDPQRQARLAHLAAFAKMPEAQLQIMVTYLMPMEYKRNANFVYKSPQQWRDQRRIGALNDVKIAPPA
jgi:hypothetical protein